MGAQQRDIYRPGEREGRGKLPHGALVFGVFGRVKRRHSRKDITTTERPAAKKGAKTEKTERTYSKLGSKSRVILQIVGIQRSGTKEAKWKEHRVATWRKNNTEEKRPVGPGSATFKGGAEEKTFSNYERERWAKEF